MSEIRVDTISEKTSANGVSIDGLTIKDGNIVGDITLTGTTPTLTIGDGGAEDASLIFDGNALNFSMGLDDSTDLLTIGLGNTLGQYPAITIDENTNVVIPDSSLTVIGSGNYDLLTLTSTDADANSGPNLRLYRNSSSPANDDVTGVIQFEGRNNNSQDFISSEIKSVTSDVADGSEDGYFALSVMNGGSLDLFLGITGAETVINDTSKDHDFRVESNSYAHCLFVDGGNDRVGVGESTDIGGLFRISLGDSGVTGVDAGGQGLVIEDNASGGLTIATPNDAEGGIKFADPQDNDVGRINYDHSTDAMFFMTSGNEQLRITADGKIGFKESSPEGSDGSLTLNQAGGDTQIISMKSSDVAHSMTSIAEADTYGFFKKSDSNAGGIQMVSMNDNGNVALQILGISNGGEDTGKGTGDHGCVRIDAASRSGTSLGTQGANTNMVTICNNNTVRFIFDAEGDFHADSGSTTFDAYQDAQLVRAYDLSHGKGVIASKFDKFVQYNASDLTDAGLVGKVNNEYNEDGTKANPLINMSGFMRLHNGAIWQQYEKHQKLASAFYKLAEKTIGKEEADKLLTEEEIQLLN
jgi:hypothetical protein